MGKLFKPFMSLVLSVLVISGCSINEEDSITLKKPSSGFGKASVNQDPVAKYLRDAMLGSANGRIEQDADDSVAYYIDEDGLTSYSFLTSGFSWERIVNTVFIDRDSNYLNYNIIYEPTKEHLEIMDDQPGSMLHDFSGRISYESVSTGEIFYSVNMEKGVIIESSDINSAGRIDDGQYDCYPDQQHTVVCYYRVYNIGTGGGKNNPAAYPTINPRTGKKEFQNADGESMPHIDIICHLDKDFSECHLTWFNTDGYTAIPQYAQGSGALTGVILNSVIEPTNLPNDNSLLETLAIDVLNDLTYDPEFSGLTDYQQDRLKAVFKKTFSIDINRKIFYELRNSNLKIKYRVSSTISTPGRYDPRDSSITFNSTKAIDYMHVLEEHFHAYQDLKVGILDIALDEPDYKGKSNIEFEAKLFHDIVYKIKFIEIFEAGLTTQYLGNNSDEYDAWLDSITENGTTFPDWSKISDRYYEFLEKFIDFNPEYDYEIDYSMKPDTMLELFSKFQ